MENLGGKSRFPGSHSENWYDTERRKIPPFRETFCYILGKIYRKRKIKKNTVSKWFTCPIQLIKCPIKVQILPAEFTHLAVIP